MHILLFYNLCLLILIKLYGFKYFSKIHQLYRMNYYFFTLNCLCSDILSKCNMLTIIFKGFCMLQLLSLNLAWNCALLIIPRNDFYYSTFFLFLTIHYLFLEFFLGYYINGFVAFLKKKSWALFSFKNSLTCHFTNRWLLTEYFY